MAQENTLFQPRAEIQEPCSINDAHKHERKDMYLTSSGVSLP